MNNITQENNKLKHEARSTDLITSERIVVLKQLLEDIEQEIHLLVDNTNRRGTQ